MPSRTTFQSGTPWEPRVGYARAVRTGNHICVSGTTATDEQGRLTGKGDPAQQARQAIANIERALRAVGAELRHVVRTRMYVTDIKNWEAVGRAHGEVFAAIRPATSLVQVSALVDPDMLVEIEADAVIDD
jgi:enamine deaminase RidA (YjgF/YER057c/UK114 family)